MKAPFFIAVVISFLLISLHVRSQPSSSDSCSSNPNPTSLSLPFDASSLHCVDAWGSQGFVLRYAQASPNVWNFLLSAPNTNAYVAMGFSPNGKMVGSTAVVGWVGADGALVMKKYYLGGQSPSQVTVQPPDQGLQIGNSSMALQSDTVYMAYQLIGGGQPTSRLIYSVGPQGFVPSDANFRLREHRDMISISFNYQSGQFQARKVKPVASLRRSHGILNMLGWSIFLAIGAMVARYMKGYDPIWFYGHVALQLLGFVLGLAGVVCGLVLESRLKASVSKHKGLGIFVLVLGCLQMSAIFARPDKASKVRKYWNWYHYVVGRVIIVVAAINVFYGIHLAKAGSKWNASFAVVLVVLFLVNVGFEAARCFRR